MASTASSPPPINILIGRSSRKSASATRKLISPEVNRPVLRVGAAAESDRAAGPNPKGPVADSRIHWENEDEGWLGVDTRDRSTKQKKPEAAERESDFLAEQQFADLLNDSSDSHYQFLGVVPQADLEEIKAAYRRLSKEYHPDTTALPDMVDRLGGRNLPLSDQAMSALTIDIAIIFFAIGCIVYVLYFKEPY